MSRVPHGRVVLAELTEVPRIPRRKERGAQARVDQSTGLLCGGQSCPHRVSEAAGNEGRPARPCVHSVQLACGKEPAEAPLPVGEQALDLGVFARATSPDDDLAAHRREAVVVHDAAVAAPGGA